MALTLQKMCENAARRYGMRLEAGERGLYHTVNWIHTLESEQAAHFLHGGELVFTTGIGAEGADWLLHFADELKAREACGLVVNLGPYVAELPEGLKAYCNENDFPLFTVPWETRLVDMTRDFCNRIIEREKKEESMIGILKSLILYPQRIEDYAQGLERNGLLRDEGCLVVCMKIREQAERLPEHYETFLKGKLEHFFCQENLRYVNFKLDDAEVYLLFDWKEGSGKLSGQIAMLQHDREELVQFHVGVGAQDGKLETLSENYKRAKGLLSVCEKRRRSILCYDELDLERVLLAVSDKAVLQAYYNDSVGRLLAYDMENGTQYTKVLSTYLQFDGSIKQAADVLFVHRNTINYQLGRIKKILGCGFSTLEEKMKLRLAFLAGDFL
ncbi:MAG: PucR family transcriptional regulator [Lachnospiraceae bacterium]|nr:PucR family transcriptional regulator [Lachnospiraceae bacterium]